MEPVRIRDDVDPEYPEYRRNLIIVIMVVVFLSLVGGTWLGYKIRGAEDKADAAEEQPVDDEDAPSDGTEQRGDQNR
ncbi:MAG: hypothetical protein ACOCV2_03670 [Persicimonas sp.]